MDLRGDFCWTGSEPKSYVANAPYSSFSSFNVVYPQFQNWLWILLPFSINKVDDTTRLIFLSFFAFGILGSFLVNYYAPPFCQAVYSDDLQNKILAFQGTLYLGAEASAFVLRLFKKTEPSNHTSHSNYRVNHVTEQIHNSWIYRFLTSFMSPNLTSSSDFKAEDLIPDIEELKE